MSSDKQLPVKLFSLDGKVALVTGAASGLGAHFAQTLSAAGASVVCVARRKDRIEAVAASIRAKGGQALAVAADVTDRDSVEAAFDAAERSYGVVDVLVNNAGVSYPGLLTEIPEEQWNAVIDVNLTAVWRVSQCAARRLRDAGKRGCIINIASVLGMMAKPLFGIYGTAKAGLLQLTRNLALDCLPLGIRVNAISPGYFRTELTDWFFDTDEGQKEAELLPLGRIGRVEELDGPLLLLASDASSYMNGSVLTVDSGHSIRLS
jgi:NAD(P)-dependent dehydrogenase (short-subunit alcohol dehydrogenase family)